MPVGQEDYEVELGFDQVLNLGGTYKTLADVHHSVQYTPAFRSTQTPNRPEESSSPPRACLAQTSGLSRQSLVRPAQDAALDSCPPPGASCLCISAKSLYTIPRSFPKIGREGEFRIGALLSRRVPCRPR